ncbi:ABC transporter substrate-binding protein [Rhizobium terrae]|uniref:ABC transporter substrate-binding protein n=1 Tax=Rhizobium terrae TaxID=2171756 RepID=UPI0019673410|nr:ABC transporter substrate-binding protein [Rhizobium terrae]
MNRSIILDRGSKAAESPSSRPGLTRRALCVGLAGGLALPFIGKARAAAISDLQLFGPPAGPSVTLAYAAGAGFLNGIADKVSFKVWRTPDEMRAGLTSRTMHAVVMPVTAAANLHTKGLGLKLANVMTNGLLYVISSNPAVRQFSDLKGRKVTVPFANDTPELVFDAVLAHYGMRAGTDVAVDRAGTPTETIQMLLAGRIDLAIVPEPAATAAILKAAAGGKTIHRAIDMQAEWGKVTGLGPLMPQAGLAFSQTFLDEYPDKVEPLLLAIEKAAAAVIAHPAEAAKHAAPALELPPQVIEKSIPYANLVATRARSARPELEALYKAISAANPQMIGGRMPAETLYL